MTVILEDDYVAKLSSLAEQAHVNPGTLARSLLSVALDEAEPSAASITALLDSIDGAFDQARTGTVDVRAGRYLQLQDV